MNNENIADLLFPDIDKTVEYYKEKYPNRNLVEGAKVTRFAPSPTGFMHVGNFLQAIISYINAYNSKGVFYLRNEDTDKKREIEGAVELIFGTLKNYEMTPNEYEINGEIVGNYGPYVQSEREEIYQTFIKHFITIGRAYPCFCTAEDLESMREHQTSNKKRIGYYGKYAKCRELKYEEVEEKIKAGIPYVIRFKSMGNPREKIKFYDEVKGEIEFPENDNDIVIMKSDVKLPTYHFAHLVDDYLMGTTHVTRGEEWLSSVPVHVELFKALGAKAPKYIHNPLVMKKEGEVVRKLSKRKDPECSMNYYDELGFPNICVVESLMTIINSNYEEWRDKNPDKHFTEFSFSPKKMSSSGGLYSIEKLENISKNYISKLAAKDVYENLLTWTSKYDEEFNEILKNNKEYAISILNIEREQKKPRKDFSCYSEIKNSLFYMFEELFNKDLEEYEFNENISNENIKEVLAKYIEVYEETDDKDMWFTKCKDLCDSLNFASNMKEYKERPEDFVGNIADLTTIIRVAITTKTNTPDLYELLKLLGKEKVNTRFQKVINNLK
ncbi:MAG: glutamate--tRNA ligase [bacterium]